MKGGSIMLYLHKKTEISTAEKDDDDGEGAKVLVPC